MHRHVRLLIAALTATVVLGTAVGSASAGRLSVTNSQFRVVWRNLELSNTATEGTIRCTVTFEGSFHSATISKIRNAQIGRVTAAHSINICTGGSNTINRETLPWDILYQSFTGTLPNITGIAFLLTRASFASFTGGNSCRATFTTENPGGEIAIIGAGGRIEGARADESRIIPLTNGPGGAFCGLASGRFAGTASFTQLGTTNTISVRLI